MTPGIVLVRVLLAGFLLYCLAPLFGFVRDLLILRCVGKWLDRCSPEGRDRICLELVTALRPPAPRAPGPAALAARPAAGSGERDGPPA